MGLHIIELKIDGYERVIEIQDPARDFHGFIAIHNTTMGPGLGGTRIIPYANREEALEDVLRLSKGMTYKAALGNTHTGGSKSTLILPPSGKTPGFLQAFAEAVNYLEGKHICAQDMNCFEENLRLINQVTPHCLGLPEDGTGNPARFTAWGVFKSIQATAKYLWGSDSLEGKKIALQGIGGVGGRLLEHLFWAGADLFVSDFQDKLLKDAEYKYAAKPVASDKILSLECDILAPCARGGILNSVTIPQLNCAAVVGAANNQLLEIEDGEKLHTQGILYAPDYLVNAGGLINIAAGLDPNGAHAQKTLQKVNQIYPRLIEIYDLAKKREISPRLAADQLVETLLDEEKSEKNAMV
ncbi:MAG: Leucine dehydrogenase [Chlamydiae bacterium]|nr:Leucine dehydrogenase [Chlamydiota bacterium]